MINCFLFLFLTIKLESLSKRNRSTEQLSKLYSILLNVFFKVDIVNSQINWSPFLLIISKLPLDSISRLFSNFFSE